MARALPCFSMAVGAGTHDAAVVIPTTKALTGPDPPYVAQMDTPASLKADTRSVPAGQDHLRTLPGKF